MAKEPITKSADLAKPAGKDPVGKPVEPEKIEPLEIAATEPYPTGGAPDDDAAFKAAHGFARAKE